MSEIPAWDRLAGAGKRAQDRGDMVQAKELYGAARDAWLRHCEAVHAQEQARARWHVHSVWTRDEERAERDR